MPFEHGPGLNQDQSFAPAREGKAQDNPKQPISLAEPGLWGGAMQNLELMPESKVLEHDLRAAVNGGKQDAHNGSKQRKHWRTRLFCQIWKSSRSCNPFFATHRPKVRDSAPVATSQTRAL
jgi:hypothetical protein